MVKTAQVANRPDYLSKGKLNGHYPNNPRHNPKLDIVAPGSYHDNGHQPGFIWTFFTSNFGSVLSLMTLLGGSIIAGVTVYNKAVDTNVMATRSQGDIQDIKVFMARQDQINQFIASAVSDIRSDVKGIRHNAR